MCHKLSRPMSTHLRLFDLNVVSIPAAEKQQCRMNEQQHYQMCSSTQGGMDTHLETPKAS